MRTLGEGGNTQLLTFPGNSGHLSELKGDEDVRLGSTSLARILRKTLENLSVEYPVTTAEEREAYSRYRAQLRSELGLRD